MGVAMSKCFDERLTSISLCSLNLTLNYLFNFKRIIKVVYSRLICYRVVRSESRLVIGVQGGSRRYYSRRLVVGSGATCEEASVAKEDS